jgi:GT2 family glycosyltransferase
MRSVAPNEVSDEDLARDLKEFLSDHDATLKFPAHKEPLVSIVVVTYNKALYTYECLRSLLADPLPEHEVIIVDNASSDETPWLLRKTANALIIRNAENQFFARACNQGARSARGKYLLFLNNDAFVHPGCISSLLETMDSAPNIGAAGAKIIWRNGRLQEAGSIIWSDGSTQAYGRGDDPTKPEYCSTRDVDYCSAACIIVRRDAFEKLGGFDEAFKPAYYEDVDLCMRLWSAGYRVVYQPLAVVTHVEFAGSSFDTATELMKKNRLIFRAKHKEALEKQLPFSAGNIPGARTRAK